MNQLNNSRVIFILIIVLVGFVVTLNYREQFAVDKSKIPQKVEESRGFQRWITNLKNKDFVIDADEFRLVEENEIYNTKWMTVKSLDQKGVQDEYDKIISEKIEDRDKVVFSPNKRQFIDYKNIDRDGYKSNEVHYYGLREDKVLDARFLDCSISANCYYDRAYFLQESNDVFVVSEFSRNISKKDDSVQLCLKTEVCEYTIKLHVIDLNSNSRLIYESIPFEIILEDAIPEL